MSHQNDMRGPWARRGRRSQASPRRTRAPRKRSFLAAHFADDGLGRVFGPRLLPRPFDSAGAPTSPECERLLASRILGVPLVWCRSAPLCALFSCKKLGKVDESGSTRQIQVLVPERVYEFNPRPSHSSVIITEFIVSQNSEQTDERRLPLELPLERRRLQHERRARSARWC
jgi:hypothetical protein